MGRAAIDSLIAAFRVTENGLMAVVASDQTISWHMPSRGLEFTSTDAHALLHPADDAEKLLGDAIFTWSKEGAPTDRGFTFRHGGERWWGWRMPLQTGHGHRDVLLAIPAKDLSARLLTVTSPLSYGLLLLIGVCVFLLVRLATGYRGRLVRMTQAASHSTATEEELRALIDEGESDHLEFKSTLRWNLRESRPGREIARVGRAVFPAGGRGRSVLRAHRAGLAKAQPPQDDGVP